MSVHAPVGRIGKAGMRLPIPFRWCVFTLSAVAIAVVWGAYAQVVQSVLEAQTRESVAKAEVMVDAFAKSTHRAVHEVDITLRALALEFEESGLTGIRRFLDRMLYDPTLIHHFTVLDAEGTVLFRSEGPDGPANQRDETAFAFLQGTGRDLMHIGAPFPGATSGAPLLRFSRRLSGADGRFAGILIANIDPDVLGEFYQQANLGPQGVATLIGLDKVIRARGARQEAGAVGLTIPHSRLWEELRRSLVGVYWQESKTDGVLRAFAYRMVENYPLVAAIGVALVDIEAAVADLRRTLFVLAAILTVSIMLVTLFLLVQHRTAEQLRAALALNRNFLARVSHELRTPLNAIIGFSEVIRDQMLGPQAGGRYADYARDIHESGRHLLGLIDDIMDLSRLQAGALPLHPEELDVAPVVQWAFRMVAPQADAKRIRLEMDAEPGGHSVKADESALRQMLLNLLTNAVTFTPDGGRILVTVGGGAQGGCRVRVMDNGIGMTPEQIHQATVPFGQPEVHVAQPGQGSGLGLSIVKSLMEAHGGRLHIDSRPGEGSRFTLDFAA